MRLPPLPLFIRHLFLHALNVFFPATCAGCGGHLPATARALLCAACGARLAPYQGLLCRRCGVPLPDGGAHCFACRHEPPRYLTVIRSAGVYDGLLKELIKYYKFQHKDYLCRPLADILLRAYRCFDELQPVDMVVPVPLHWSRRLARGYNQSALLAQHLAHAIQKPCAVRCLHRVRLTRPQYRLTRAARQQNLQGSVAAVPAYVPLLRQKNILLIDDICTTTATLNECARALHAVGVAGVRALTLARD